MCGRRPSKTDPATLRICWLSCGMRAQTCNSSSPGAQNPARECCSSRDGTLAVGRVVTQISLIAQLRGWRAIMDLLVERVDVWSATIEDRPGGLAQALATLRDAGADLQCIIARRAESGKGVLFVTPLQGDREIAAAAQVGFNVTNTLHSVRVMGRDRPGIAAELTQKLAEERINLRGFSGSVIGTQFLAYVAVDSREDANKVIEILEKA